MRNSSRVTIRDVAQACGVSPMTVSYVLNGKREKVGTDTCARVLQAVRELNYSPPSLNVSSRQEPAPLTLGVVSDVPSFSLMDSKGGYVNAILSGILERSEVLQHSITLFPGNLLHTDMHRSIRIYCDGRCDGLLIFSPFRDSPFLAALQERGTPFITVGNLPEDARVSGVDVDDVEAGETATNYLISQGHRRIAYLNMLDSIESSNRRKQGYHKALRVHGLEVPTSDFIQWPSPEGSDYIPVEATCHRVVRERLALPADRRPTALLCFNDLFAIYCLDALEGIGLRVPHDVSVIGVDDAMPIAQERQLTTLRQPFTQMGRQAVDLLVARISSPGDAPMRELLPLELVMRKTVGRPAES